MNFHPHFNMSTENMSSQTAVDYQQIDLISGLPMKDIWQHFKSVYFARTSLPDITFPILQPLTQVIFQTGSFEEGLCYKVPDIDVARGFKLLYFFV